MGKLTFSTDDNASGFASLALSSVEIFYLYHTVLVLQSRCADSLFQILLTEQEDEQRRNQHNNRSHN